MPLTPLAADGSKKGDQLIHVNDTLASFDVTDLKTGMIVVSAYDKAGNEAQSMAQLMRLTDYKAPDAPDSLVCQTVILGDRGYAMLNWKMTNPLDDDIDYSDVAFANDSTHTFLPGNQAGIKETMYIDTLALDVNQKYVYYKVRAIDYSGNIGEWSERLRVKRPHNTPPTTPHLDSSSHNDETGMQMRWVVGMDADMDYHLLQRRIGEDGEWEVLQRWDADSLAAVKNWSIDVYDNPSFDQERRIYYRVESFNSTTMTSTSMAVSWMHRGPRYFDIAVRLSGDYVQSADEVRLAWDTGEIPALVKDVPYYYCVFRKAPGEDSFHYVENIAKEEREYTDHILGKGEEAQYYVVIRFKDGRQSTPSNTVTVSRNK